MSTLDSLPVPEGHPVRHYLGSLDSEASRLSMWSAVRRACELMQQGRRREPAEVYDWTAVEPEDLERLRQRLVELYKPATGRRYLSAVRGVLESAMVLGVLDGNRYARLTHRRALRPIRGESAPPGRALALDELRAIYAACGRDWSHLGARDAALLAVLQGCGLRRAEAIGLDLASVDLPGRTLRVQGKGRRERVVPIPAGVVTMLEDWIAARGLWAGPLFVPLGNEGREPGRRMAHSTVRWVVERRAQQAGISRLTVHDLRRTYVSGLLDQDHGIDTCARLAGHKRLDTTARYDRRGDARARRAGEGVEVPAEHVTRPLRPLEGGETCSS